jgi:dUTP pyrophosphatase
MKFLPGNGEPEYPALRYYKTDPNAISPTWGTDDAACFDLSACLSMGDGVKVFRPDNRTRVDLITAAKPNFQIFPQERAMVPTGLIFDIPVGFELKIYVRSGTALKKGISLINSVGVVDYGYVDPSYLILVNSSAVTQEIAHGDRIAQGQMKRIFTYEVLESPQPPPKKTDRIGGFGSTGSGAK